MADYKFYTDTSPTAQATELLRCVKLWEEPIQGEYPATKELVVIEVSSYGGDTTGYQIPYNIHYTGIKTQGYWNPTTKAFTETAPTV